MSETRIPTQKRSIEKRNKIIDEIILILWYTDEKGGMPYDQKRF